MTVPQTPSRLILTRRVAVLIDPDLPHRPYRTLATHATHNPRARSRRHDSAPLGVGVEAEPASRVTSGLAPDPLRQGVSCRGARSPEARAPAIDHPFASSGTDDGTSSNRWPRRGSDRSSALTHAGCGRHTRWCCSIRGCDPQTGRSFDAATAPRCETPEAKGETMFSRERGPWRTARAAL